MTLTHYNEADTIPQSASSLILSDMDVLQNSLSIYIHIPFCGVKCTYCAFNTYVSLDHLIEPFVGALNREIEIVGSNTRDKAVGTIFFGGGTPSLLTPEQFRRIFSALRNHFAIQPDAEITIEANPSDITRDYLVALRNSGINRLSIGMQSANANELKLFNRRHDNDAVVRAVSAARAAGFDNLNLDVIYGVPHQTLQDWGNTLTQLVALKPDHVSLYGLTLEDNTPMLTWVEQGKLPLPDDDLAADMYNLATDRLRDAGFAQYEISNWAKPGRECRHNLQYWRSLPYIGFGPGAHGFADEVRYSVLLSPQRYIAALNDASGTYPFPTSPVTEQFTRLSIDAQIVEALLMGLRLTHEGIPRHMFSQRFGVDVVTLHRDILDKYAGYGLITVDDERVRLTDEGRLLSNMIFREFV